MNARVTWTFLLVPAISCFLPLGMGTKCLTAASPHAVVAVKPSNPVLHGLEVKTQDDSERRWVTLRGPAFYSAPELIQPGALPSYLTWYAIRKPGDEPVKRLRLTDEYSGKTAFSVMLGKPAFFLMPAQLVSDGPPREVPENLNHFLAFEIVNVDSVSLPEPTPGKPAYVCLPAEEWHHEEHFPIKSESSLLMVYEVPSRSGQAKATTIDQFGLNALKSEGTREESNRFVYVAAKRAE